MYENYMDYSNDACMYIFTEEQVWRMRAILSGSGCRRKMYYNGAQLSNGQTLMPSGEFTWEVTYHCNDGCAIAEDWVDDGYCDCECCEDESTWTCETCRDLGCPTQCSEYVLCDGSGTGNDTGRHCNPTTTLSPDSNNNQNQTVFGNHHQTLMPSRSVVSFVVMYLIETLVCVFLFEAF